MQEILEQREVVHEVAKITKFRVQGITEHTMTTLLMMILTIMIMDIKNTTTIILTLTMNHTTGIQWHHKLTLFQFQEEMQEVDLEEEDQLQEG